MKILNRESPSERGGIDGLIRELDNTNSYLIISYVSNFGGCDDRI